MKIAITGKGGVGKSTVAAALCLLLAEKGNRVLALDADPDANLAAALGIPRHLHTGIIPLSQQRALIEERTGARVKEYGQMFRLNPKVEDIAEKYAFSFSGVSLMVLGAIESGGSGCACPENVLIRALVKDLVLYKNDALIMDMEAGIEHLGRGTAQGVDQMLIIVEPGRRSVDSAQRIIRMAKEIGIQRIQIIGNKVATAPDRSFITEAFSDKQILSFIPYSEVFREADRDGVSVLKAMDVATRDVFESILEYLQQKNTEHRGQHI